MLKEKIVDAAYDLFGEKGYEKTSVAEIIEKAGASKGGFYHHFKTKEDILETITFGYIDVVKEHYQLILLDDRLSLLEKFVEAYYRINAMKVDSVKDWDKIRNLYNGQENHILLRKMGEAFERETADYYLQLIESGVAEGVFKTDYPKALAELWSREVIRFQRMSRKVLLERDSEEEFYKVLSFNEQLINGQLGLEKQKIELVTAGRQYLEEMHHAMTESQKVTL